MRTLRPKVRRKCVPLSRKSASKRQKRVPLGRKVRQKHVPLGKKSFPSSFGMELSRPRGPHLPPERNAELAKSIEFYHAFCDMSDLPYKRRGVGER